MKNASRFNKEHRKLFKNTGSKSLYSEFEPYFINYYRHLFISKCRKEPFSRNSQDPTLNNTRPQTPSLNTIFLEEEC